ncbi:hypothetical protein SAMN05421759_107144 [Roseivivax lentus]|uniref:DUF4398 domain-containing protein n=1 Tax=Roseivivax lentus TaxID=633194 RepID=A0A1N7NAV2_9RHOB|nr:hypothetical protein [Roseivivax lentus]SIS95432.1 hypothetical protein SAMN05421759_107144 [Roseivivax lentus]
MNKSTRYSIGAVAASWLLLLAACDGIDFSQDNSRSFAATYSQARGSLEAGNFETAAKRYDAMLATAGPLETRLRLEKSHALLRADRYAAASQEARIVAESHSDNRRAAALAVVGTAEHRLAQEAMSQGDFGPTTVGHLTRARNALKEMLATAPDLDPLGSMANRLAMVEASLKNLGA